MSGLSLHEGVERRLPYKILVDCTRAVYARRPPARSANGYEYSSNARSAQEQVPIALPRRQFRSLEHALGDSGIQVSGYSFDGKSGVGTLEGKAGVEEVLAQYGRFRSGEVAQRFREKYGAEPKYDAILFGRISDGNALGANIVTGDGKQYLMIDERHAPHMDARLWDQVFSHEWHHGIGIYDEVQTSSLNRQLYDELADRSSGFLRDAYRRNAAEESMRAQYQASRPRYAA